MCFNYKVSLFTTISSVLLMKYGNPKYKSDNLVFGIFLLFISAIQLMDFIFWIDLQNKMGINHAMTVIGPLLNVGQPIILYLIKMAYLMRRQKLWTSLDISVAFLNLCYLLYMVKVYITFIFSSANAKLITSRSAKTGNLEWGWLQFTNPYPYLLLFAINIFYLTDFNYSLLLFLITYFFLYLSVKYFAYSAGELWCFFGSFIPILMLFLSYSILTGKSI